MYRFLTILTTCYLFTLNRIHSADVSQGIGLHLLRMESVAGHSLWPKGIVPYVIDPDVPKPERIQKAIDHWAARTPIYLTPRTNQVNYVRFVRQNSDGLCFSAIGMLGGEQKIKTDDQCEEGTLLHEIGHAIGLWHEQSRPDRDRYVKVLYSNLQSGSARDFDRRDPARNEYRPYDYASIMHYGAFADSDEKRGPTIETIPPGIPIGQRSELSLGDIDAVRHMYGYRSNVITIATHTSGLRVIVDGIEYTAPKSFEWKHGTRHTVEAPLEQIAGNRLYKFGRWNDEGPQRHDVMASEDLTIYTANFIAAGSAVFTEPRALASGFSAWTSERVRNSFGDFPRSIMATAPLRSRLGKSVVGLLSRARQQAVFRPGPAEPEPMLNAKSTKW